MSKIGPMPMKIYSDGRNNAFFSRQESEKQQNYINMSGGSSKMSVPCPTTVGSAAMREGACEASIAANTALVNAKMGAIYEGEGGGVRNTLFGRSRIKKKKKKKNRRTNKRSRFMRNLIKKRNKSERNKRQTRRGGG